MAAENLFVKIARGPDTNFDRYDTFDHRPGNWMTPFAGLERRSRDRSKATYRYRITGRKLLNHLLEERVQIQLELADGRPCFLCRSSHQLEVQVFRHWVWVP